MIFKLLRWALLLAIIAAGLYGLNNLSKSLNAELESSGSDFGTKPSPETICPPDKSLGGTAKQTDKYQQCCKISGADDNASSADQTNQCAALGGSQTCYVYEAQCIDHEGYQITKSSGPTCGPCLAIGDAPTTDPSTPDDGGTPGLF